MHMSIFVQLESHQCNDYAYMFDQGALVLESVTLAEMVELVVEVFVNLASSAIFDEKTAQDPQTAHP